MLERIVSSVLILVGSIGVTAALALAVAPQQIASPTRQVILRMDEVTVTPAPAPTFSVEFTEAEAKAFTPPAEIHRQS